MYSVKHGEAFRPLWVHQNVCYTQHILLIVFNPYSVRFVSGLDYRSLAGRIKEIIIHLIHITDSSGKSSGLFMSDSFIRVPADTVIHHGVFSVEALLTWIL